MTIYLALSAPPHCIRTLKTHLQRDGILNRRLKIRADSTDATGERRIIVSNQTTSTRQIEDDPAATAFFATYGCGDGVRATVVDGGEEEEPIGKLARALLRCLDELGDYDKLKEDIREVGKLSYCVYGSMLLGNGAGRASKVWDSVRGTLATEDPHTEERFFESVCEIMGVSHMAINAPISRLGPSGCENVLRSPRKIQPVYGDFGVVLPPFPDHVPSSSDFDRAFWASTTQNGIFQTWAPLYTMFSQGNVTEKKRLLDLPTVRDAVDQGAQSGKGCSAVDLFAGIGYFAFSYAAAGVAKAFCWDLNPWSVEGLKRGAGLNGWGCCVGELPAKGGDNAATLSKEITRTARHDSTKFVVFPESNVHAVQRLNILRGIHQACIPPIRHVNAGMLPTAAMAWRTAVALIDKHLGGWVHLHESVIEEDLQSRVVEILEAVRQAWTMAETQERAGQETVPMDASDVRLEHLERVKSMGPKLIHVVLDIWVPPRTTILK